MAMSWIFVDLKILNIGFSIKNITTFPHIESRKLIIKIKRMSSVNSLKYSLSFDLAKKL